MLGNSDDMSRYAKFAAATYKPVITEMDAKSGLLDLRLQNHRLMTALNNITQGVCFFDGERRLVLANRRYAEIYDLPLECIEPGTSLAEIATHRFTAGSFPVGMSLEQYLDWRADIQQEGEPSDTVVKLKNGRSILIRRRPMPDQGWVSTHEDITDRASA
jgi:PAS domain-containing protein